MPISRFGVTELEAGLNRSAFASQIALDAFTLDLLDEGGGGLEVAADLGAGGIGPDDGLAMEEVIGVDGFMGFGEGDFPFAFVAGGAWHGPGEEAVKPCPLAREG